MAAALACEAILDGEIVHLDAAGKPQFYHLLRRRSPQYFVAFDLLWLRGRDLRTLPLIERKRGLTRLLRGASPAWRDTHVNAPPPLIYADHVEGNGTRLFQLAVSLGAVESLIEQPALMSHASYDAEYRRAHGISDSLVRLSVGLEAFEDLRDDLEQALAQACG